LKKRSKKLLLALSRTSEQRTPKKQTFFGYRRAGVRLFFKKERNCPDAHGVITAK
jgi:hypothetical protein